MEIFTVKEGAQGDRLGLNQNRTHLMAYSLRLAAMYSAKFVVSPAMVKEHVDTGEKRGLGLDRQQFH